MAYCRFSDEPKSDLYIWWGFDKIHILVSHNCERTLRGKMWSYDNINGAIAKTKELKSFGYHVPKGTIKRMKKDR